MRHLEPPRSARSDGADGVTAYGGAARRLRILLAAALLLGLTSWLLVAGFTTGTAHAADAGSTDSDAESETGVVGSTLTATAAEEELAQKYVPVMMLVHQKERCGPGEGYVPSAVDPLFDEPSIALRGPWTDHDLVTVAPGVEQLAEGLPGYVLDMPGDSLRPGCDYETWVDSLWGRNPTPTTYAHVATEAGVEDRLALQYFFFYPFNDYNNKHEGDWERIQIEFPVGDVDAALETDPDVVIYSQHYGSERAQWDGGKLTLDGTHPMVFVSAGSHASKFTEGLYLGRSATEGFGCDTTIGPHDELRPEVVTIPTDPDAAAEAFPWITYRGHWGEVGPQRFYEGPTGPIMKQAWAKPFTWSAKARDASFSLPGAEVAGSRAGTSFCGLVAGGSDLFRQFSANPWPVLLALVAGALLFGWVVRRSGWADAVALPLVSHRRPAQVVAASMRMLAARWRVFLLVAAPAALASVVSSVLTAVAPSASAWWWSLLNGLMLVLLGLALAWAQVASAQAVVDIDESRPVTLASLAQATRARVPALVTTLALWALVLLPLLITGVLSPVALVLFVAWSLVLPVVQLDGYAGPRALRRSWRLVRRQIPTVLLVLAVAAVLMSTLGGLLATLVFLVSPAPFSVVSGVPQLVTTLVWPVTALMTTYAWANGRAIEAARADDVEPVAEGATTA